MAKEHNIRYRSKYTAYYDKKYETEIRKLGPNDLIFVENNYKTGANPKLQPTFLGPYEIIRIGETNVWYKDGKKQKNAHLNRVKKAILDESWPQHVPTQHPQEEENPEKMQEDRDRVNYDVLLAHQ